MIDFELSPRAPAPLREDLEVLYVKASAHGMTVYMMAYPWVEIQLWYDPSEYPELHVEHWRFWMNGRRVFWEWGLHAPLTSNAALTQRRKRKMAAVAARLVFISMNNATFGYYNFLHRLEYSGNTLLMWWGGLPGKTSSAGSASAGPTSEDLGEMCRRNKFEYKTRIHSALTPGRLDKNAYKNMTSLLVLSGALNPACKKPENRLSDLALARVRLDVTSQRPARKHWKGNLKAGVWKALVEDTRIRDLQATVEAQLRDSTYEIPRATAFDPKEATKSGYDPFKKADGSYTALAPDEGLPVDYDDVVAAQGDDDATSETVDEVIDMTGDQSQVVEGIPLGNNNDEISDSSSTASLLRKVNEKTPKTESK
ncbi:hypothetical protein PR003_g5322 [Phytophthora rubi]|uniref:Uncharacterized protein n=2 Tax=Phytophthora rubi TaxID=129364 RepID=A0A6A4FT53_9STRA|nr:hypothetical protein PR003_g5322 [Phytophthora rubi]